MKKQFSITNEQIRQKFGLSVPHGKTESNIIVVEIGELKESGNIPVKLAQCTTRFIKEKSAVARAMGWNQDSIVTHIQNFKKSVFDNMKLEIGSTVLDCNISVKYSLEPTYEGQERMVDPRTGEEITANGGNPVYRTTLFTTNVADENTIKVDGKDIPIVFDSRSTATVRS